MHPEIAEWPNRMFYSREQLIPVPLPHQLEESTEPRLVFIPSEACKEIGLSDKVNINEAHIVCEQLHHIYKRYGHLFNSQKTVGVIVPYRNQIAVIRKEIEQLETEQKQIEDALCSGMLSIEELTEKSKRLPVLKDELDEKSLRWLELSEIENR